MWKGKCEAQHTDCDTTRNTHGTKMTMAVTMRNRDKV